MQGNNISEQIEIIIADCNNAIKLITTGNHIAWCGTMYQIAQKLLDVNKTVKEEISNRDNQIATMQKFIDDLNNGGAQDGTD